MPEISDTAIDAPDVRAGAALADLELGAIMVADRLGVIQDVNPAACGLTGYERGELVGMNGLSLVAPEWSDFAVRQHNRKIESEQETTSYDCGFLHRNGTRIPVQVRSRLVRDDHGAVIGVHAIVRDTRNVSTAAQRLRESEDRFHGAFEGAAIGMAMVAPDGRWLKVNDALTRMLGFSHDELLDLTFQDVTHHEDLERDLDAVRDVLTGRVSWYHMEKRYIRKDGTVLWGLLAVSLVRGSDGNPAYFISQISDITAAKRTTTAKLQAQSRLSKEAAELSPRELQVVRLLSDGYLTSETAGALGICDETVQTLVKRAMRKLGARNRTHLIATALRLGLVAD